MKALQFDHYGDIDVYQFKELPSPVPQPHEVLLDVRAAAINPIDGKIRKGQMGFLAGSRFPKGVGLDLAGVVVAVGKNVKRFKPNDEVFGTVSIKSPYGSVGTQTLASADELAHKPKTLSFAQAASLPVVANAALVGLRDVLHIPKRNPYPTQRMYGRYRHLRNPDRQDHGCQSHRCLRHPKHRTCPISRGRRHHRLQTTRSPPNIHTL